MSKRKLAATVNRFTDEMMRRLAEKERQGFSGWDDPDWHTWDISRRMQKKVTEVLLTGNTCDPEDLIDIANFAMFLHYKITPPPAMVEPPEEGSTVPDGTIRGPASGPDWDKNI